MREINIYLILVLGSEEMHHIAGPPRMRPGMNPENQYGFSGSFVGPGPRMVYRQRIPMPHGSPNGERIILCEEQFSTLNY